MMRITTTTASTTTSVRSTPRTTPESTAVLKMLEPRPPASPGPPMDGIHVVGRVGVWVVGAALVVPA